MFAKGKQQEATGERGQYKWFDRLHRSCLGSAKVDSKEFLEKALNICEEIKDALSKEEGDDKHAQLYNSIRSFFAVTGMTVANLDVLDFKSFESIIESFRLVVIAYYEIEDPRRARAIALLGLEVSKGLQTRNRNLKSDSVEHYFQLYEAIFKNISSEDHFAYMELAYQMKKDLGLHKLNQDSVKVILPSKPHLFLKLDILHSLCKLRLPTARWGSIPMDSEHVNIFFLHACALLLVSWLLNSRSILLMTLFDVLLLYKSARQEFSRVESVTPSEQQAIKREKMKTFEKSEADYLKMDLTRAQADLKDLEKQLENLHKELEYSKLETTKQEHVAAALRKEMGLSERSNAKFKKTYQARIEELENTIEANMQEIEHFKELDKVRCEEEKVKKIKADAEVLDRLKKIDEAAVRGWENFVDFINKEYCVPQQRDKALDRRKVILRALRAYHPDKAWNVPSLSGVDASIWLRIAKHLNSFK